MNEFPISITQKAQNHFIKSLHKRKKGIGIRIGVKTTGCSGFSYILEYVDHPNTNDLNFKYPDFSIFIDPKSLPFISGLTVDYERSGLSEGILFINPRAVNKCGCGESFRFDHSME